MRLRGTLCLLAHGVAVAAKHAAATAPGATLASDALARVDAALAWLAGNASAPVHWAIKSRDDFKTKNWKHLGGGNVKNVYEAKFEGTRVVVKTRLGTAAHQERVENDVRGELLYLEYLRDLPGVPKLYGGWINGLHPGTRQLWYVVQFAGEDFGVGKGTRHRPTRVNRGWEALVKKDPITAARALLECCRSFSDQGYFLTDFGARQFAVKGHTVSLIDGPLVLSGPMASRGVPRVALLGKNRHNTCSDDAQCPHSFSWHCCCRAKNTGEECEKNTEGGGAPEARGQCLMGTCAPLTSKTHVFDVASKAWALPYVHRTGRFKGNEKDRLLTLMARMRSPDPVKRPNFTEALSALDQRRVLKRTAALSALDGPRRVLKRVAWHGECGAFSGSLVVVPHTDRRGFKDVNFRYEFAGEIAARVGAQVYLPRPCHALAKIHNNNHLVNCTYDWSRYRNWTRVVGSTPIVANASEPVAGAVGITGATFDSQFRSARDKALNGEVFVWRLPPDVREQKKHIVALEEWQACGPRYKSRMNYVGSAMDAGPSHAVLALAARFSALHGNFSTLHLRRSDTLSHKAQKRKACDTKVSTVKTYVDCSLPSPSPTDAAGTLVVFTDERDSKYLHELHYALKSSTRDVVFGDPVLRELAGDDGADNYFVFAASLVVRGASSPQLSMDRSHCETHKKCGGFSGK